MRAAMWGLIAVAAWGCRADVEGTWTGEVGAREALLSLDQKGSAIEGEICIDDRCEPIDDGVLDEQSLVLTFGCSRCALERATLDLTLRGELEGEHHVWSCECPEEDGDCSCRAPARFARGTHRGGAP